MVVWKVEEMFAASPSAVEGCRTAVLVTLVPAKPDTTCRVRLKLWSAAPKARPGLEQVTVVMGGPSVAQAGLEADTKVVPLCWASVTVSEPSSLSLLDALPIS